MTDNKNKMSNQGQGQGGQDQNRKPAPNDQRSQREEPEQPGVRGGSGQPPAAAPGAGPGIRTASPLPTISAATVKNPNNPAFDADQDNRQQQRQGQDQGGMPRAPSASVPQPDAAPDKHK